MVRLGIFSVILAVLSASCERYSYPNDRETEAKLIDLAGELEQYLVRFRCVPETFADWTSSEMSPSRQADSWGEAYSLVRDGERTAIASSGPDREHGSSDDLFSRAVVARVCGVGTAGI